MFARGLGNAPGFAPGKPGNNGNGNGTKIQIYIRSFIPSKNCQKLNCHFFEGGMIKIPCMLGCIKPLIECWCWSCCCCNWCWNCCCCCWRFCMCIWFKSIPCWVPDPLRFIFEIFFGRLGKYKVLTEKNQENVQFSESFYNFSYELFFHIFHK